MRFVKQEALCPSALNADTNLLNDGGAKVKRWKEENPNHSHVMPSESSKGQDKLCIPMEGKQSALIPMKSQGMIKFKRILSMKFTTATKGWGVQGDVNLNQT
jgi:hypothetical protein